jgi:exo beta-1,2-glucooligosaccharide sophorohydrolase (non-reducing end)
MKAKVLTGVLFFYSALGMAQEPLYDRIFFENSPMAKSFFYSKTEYTSPSWVQNVSGKLPVSDSIFFTPGNALQLNYKSAMKGMWAVNIQFKEIRGQDNFSPATNLVFHLFVNSATEINELPQVGVSTEKNAPVFSSLKPFVTNYATNSWLKVVVPLKQFGITDSTKKTISAVAFRQNIADGKEHNLFIDQVEIINDTQNRPVTFQPKLTTATGFEKHVDITWEPVIDSAIKYIKIYRSSDNRNFYPVGIQSPYISRYADFTDTTGREAGNSITKYHCSAKTILKQLYQIQ